MKIHKARFEAQARGQKESAGHLAVLLAVLLSACGGGGGGTSPAPTPAPAPAPAPVPVPDTTKPTFSALAVKSPSPGATGIDYKAAVTFTASEAMKSAAVEVRCTDSKGHITVIEGTTAVSGVVVTFTPTVGYAPKGETCAATVQSAVDLAGNPWGDLTTITNFEAKPLDCGAPNRTLTYTGGALNSVCENVFVDSNGAHNEWPNTVALIKQAEDEVTAFYGSRVRGTVDYVFCGSVGCTDTWTFGSGRPMLRGHIYTLNGVTYVRQMVVNMGAKPAGIETLSHENAHAELHSRMKPEYAVGAPGSIPQWFDEGLAVVVSKGYESLAVCASFNAVPDLRAITSWGAVSGTNPGVYCQAGREVKAFVTKNGIGGLLNLIAAVNNGQNFYTAYGPMNY